MARLPSATKAAPPEDERKLQIAAEAQAVAMDAKQDTLPADDGGAPLDQLKNDSKLAMAAEDQDRALAKAPAAAKKASPKAAEADPAPERPSGRKAPAKGTPKSAAPVGLDDVAEPVNICMYGKEGTGKTTALLRMANLGRVLVINAEAGVKGRRLKQMGVATQNVMVWPDPETGEEITFKGLDDMFWQLKGDLLADPDSWVGVIWDSGTEIHKNLLGKVVEHQNDKAEKAGKDRDPFFIDRADYGVMTEQMRQLLRRFRDLPCHFAVSALERRDQDDDGSVEYGPALTPALMQDIGGFVDIFVHVRVNEGLDENGETVQLYTGKTRAGGKYRAKDRWAATPPLMANPFFDRIVAYISEELSADTDPDQIYARECVKRAADAEEARKASGAKKTAR